MAILSCFMVVVNENMRSKYMVREDKMGEVSQQALTKWFIGLCCQVGEEDIDYWLPETDPNWWAVYLWIKRN